MSYVNEEQRELRVSRLALVDDIAKATPAGVLPFRICEGLEGRALFTGSSVSDIKELMVRTNKYGEPSITEFRGFGHNKFPELLLAMSLYDQQVERLVNDDDSYRQGADLFYSNYSQKIRLVKDNQGSIYNHLFMQGRSYVFGRVSDKNKQKIMSVAVGSSDEEGIAMLNALNEVIANYTMLPDLRSLAINGSYKKTLQRFVKEYKK